MNEGNENYVFVMFKEEVLEKRGKIQLRLRKKC